jgi:hypothetical protein
MPRVVAGPIGRPWNMLPFGWPCGTRLQFTLRAIQAPLLNPVFRSSTGEVWKKTKKEVRCSTFWLFIWAVGVLQMNDHVSIFKGWA